MNLMKIPDAEGFAGGGRIFLDVDATFFRITTGPNFYLKVTKWIYRRTSTFCGVFLTKWSIKLDQL